MSAVCVLVVLAAHPAFGVSSGILDPEVKRPQRWALLIGVGEYANLPHLHGPMNDVEIVAYALETYYGFKKDHIRILGNEEATRNGILQEFEGLIARAHSSDIVYVHYSGHGSQVQDLNGDEFDDHKDETLVPYDGRMKNVPDITDDTLNELLNRIEARRVVVSIDACHSGSVTRGVNIRTRSVPPDTRLELYRQNQRYTRGSRIIETPHAVVFMSSAPYEQALDGRIGGRYHGYFSFAVFRSLLAAPIGATPQMIFENVKEEVRGIKHLLHRRTFPAPQLETSKRLMSKPLFPIQADGIYSEPATTQTITAHTKVLVKPTGSRMVELEPARYLGGLPTSVWEVIPVNELRSVQGTDHIFATVTAMKGMNAVAEVVGGEGINLEHAYARLVQPAKPPSRISILLRKLNDTMSNKMQKIRELFQLFGEDSQTDDFNNFVADVRGKDVEILSADGVEAVKKLSSFELGRLPTLLKRFLDQSLSTIKLRQLQNPDSSIRVNARLLNTLEDAQEHPALLSDPILHIRRSHEPATKFNSLQVEVWVNRSSYLTILDVDSEGSIKVLFPSPFQKNSYYPKGFIQANTKVTLPDSFDSSNQAGFVWDIGEPKGRDTLYIFASSDQGVAEKIRQLGRGIQYDSQRPARGDSSTMCNSYEKLRNVLFSNIHSGDSRQGCRTFESKSSHSGRSRGERGKVVDSGDKHQKVQSDWNAVSLNFWIEDPR